MMHLKINGYEVPYPNEFVMEKTPNIASSITTMSGKTLSDVNGWKYADKTFQWDTLLDSDLQNLINGINGGEFVLEFDDIDGHKSVNAILLSRASVKTASKNNGQIVWKEISIGVSFPDCYHD